jgi:AcrR family transcriptional regulator
MNDTDRPESNDPDVAGGWTETLSAHRTRQAEHIAHVAMGIIARDGYAGLSMSALAEGAGVSRQTLYKYFPDIDAVLAALARVGGAGVIELAGRMSAETRPADGLRVFVLAILEVAAAGHPSPVALMATAPPSARPDLRRHEAEAEALVIECLDRGRQDGSFREDIDPEIDGRIIYRAALAAHDLALEPGVDVAALAARVAANLLRIVEAPASRRRRAR